jgi:hypothetical protein
VYEEHRTDFLQCTDGLNRHGILPPNCRTERPTRRYGNATQRTLDVTPLRRTSVIGLAVLLLTLAIAGCDGSPSPTASASMAPDLSAIACATEDPADVGELTGAWQGDDRGIYYIRHVGDCLWWFGTEIREIQPGATGQFGFANVASGRVDGTRIDVEWADVPVGNILGGGGLTLVYDEVNDQLMITERRGDWIPFGATTFTRIEPEGGPEATPSQSASP